MLKKVALVVAMGLATFAVTAISGCAQSQKGGDACACPADANCQCGAVDSCTCGH